MPTPNAESKNHQRRQRKSSRQACPTPGRQTAETRPTRVEWRDPDGRRRPKGGGGGNRRGHARAARPDYSGQTPQGA